jgi:hypothetical protein
LGTARALILALLLATTSCGLLRWTFSDSSDGKSPAQKFVDATKENGADPFKWAAWIVTGVAAARGVVAGLGDAKRLADRRSGRDRRQPRVLDQAPERPRAGDV